MSEQTGRDAAIEIGHTAVDWSAMLTASVDPAHTHRVIHLYSRRIVATVIDALAAAGLLVSTEPAPADAARGDVYVYLRPDAMSDRIACFGTEVQVGQDDHGPVGVRVLDAVKVTIDGRTITAAATSAVSRGQVELLREIAARLTAHGDSIANLYTTVDARPAWEAARDRPSPVILERRPHRTERAVSNYSLEQVAAAVRAVAAEYPDRVDDRAGRGLAPRYVEHGTPCCLVAEVLCRLGWSVDQLKQLDHEGGRPGGGVVFARSRNRLLRRIDPVARELLDHVQRRQDRAWAWAAVVNEAFQEDSSGRHWMPAPTQNGEQ